jgi:long-chain acyl-CoA synthetase
MCFARKCYYIYQMSLAQLAHHTPTKTAVIIAESGLRITYSELHERSASLAASLATDLLEGEVIAILLDNRTEYFEICFGARRAGLYYVPVSTQLTASELEYILKDANARMLFTESRFVPLLKELGPSLRASLRVLLIDDEDSPYRSLIAKGAGLALPTRLTGLDFAYSSGTTGRPKGIRHALSGDEQLNKATQQPGWTAFFSLNDHSVYLSSAPLYHTAPLRFAMRCLAAGGTVVAMRKFEAEGALAAMERYKVTHSQWVPTMFVRFLRLPRETRLRYNLSSHQIALHAAAPCPIEVKREMIEWWGPIVWEYYTGSERAGATVISPQEWLERPGSVGRAVQGRLHVVDQQWQECPPGIDGLVCFEGGPRFAYHNDPQKTTEAYTPQGWATFGDIGHVDEAGYLFITDRIAHMIISGGVNIYPKEVENVLLEHPLVHDAAVIGIPNADFGEEVKAVVELKDASLASQATVTQLIEHCRGRLSHIKCPRSVEFATSLPRTETGKLLKRLIRDQYCAPQAQTQGISPPSSP